MKNILKIIIGLFLLFSSLGFSEHKSNDKSNDKSYDKSYEVKFSSDGIKYTIMLEPVSRSWILKKIEYLDSLIVGIKLNVGQRSFSCDELESRFKETGSVLLGNSIISIKMPRLKNSLEIQDYLDQQALVRPHEFKSHLSKYKIEGSLSATFESNSITQLTGLEEQMFYELKKYKFADPSVNEFYINIESATLGCDLLSKLGHLRLDLSLQIENYSSDGLLFSSENLYGISRRVQAEMNRQNSKTNDYSLKISLARLLEQELFTSGYQGLSDDVFVNLVNLIYQAGVVSGSEIKFDYFEDKIMRPLKFQTELNIFKFNLE